MHFMLSMKGGEVEILSAALSRSEGRSEVAGHAFWGEVGSLMKVE